MAGILNILTVYNEMKFLPIKKKWCEANGLDLYVIDNYSNDGTWEWLQDNNVPSHRVDTKGAFDLRILQKDINKTVHKIRPYWMIYNGADLFPVTRGVLHDDIMAVDKAGYNGIQMRWAMFYNTGEPKPWLDGEPFDPFNTYFYCGFERGVCMIAKYTRMIKVNADDILFRGRNVKKVDGLSINYGHTKSRKEREETYARRELAWKRGMIGAWGAHYKTAKARNWKWRKRDLTDIRTTDFAWTVDKLREWTSQ